MILKLTPDIKTRLLLYRGRLERKTLERPETDRQTERLEFGGVAESECAV